MMGGCSIHSEIASNYSVYIAYMTEFLLLHLAFLPLQ